MLVAWAHNVNLPFIFIFLSFEMVIVFILWSGLHLLLLPGSVGTSKLAREFLKGFSKWGNKDPEPVSSCQTYIHVRACFFPSVCYFLLLLSECPSGFGLHNRGLFMCYQVKFSAKLANIHSVLCFLLLHCLQSSAVSNL